MPTRPRHLLLDLTAMAAIGGGLLVAGSPSGAAPPEPVAFDFTGSAQVVTVPAGVCGANLVLAGAGGGVGTGFIDDGPVNPGSVSPAYGDGGYFDGGAGASVTATIEVGSGDVLQVNVGGGGGGGDTGGDGGGGGGATDVRTGAFGLADRVVVAGGGGGGGGSAGDGHTDQNGGLGGAGGDAAASSTAVGGDGADGTAVPPDAQNLGTGGGGGTASAGGAAGTGNGEGGLAGSLGQGADGNGLDGPGEGGVGGWNGGGSATAEGAGGGGLYGGGSGGVSEVAAGGGGAGSSFGPAGTTFAAGTGASGGADGMGNAGDDGSATIEWMPCTDVGTLTVTKVVVNTGGGTKQVADFELHVDDDVVTSGETVELDPGDHTVSEVSDPSYTAAFSGDCDTTGSVTIAAGDDAECTITNTYQAPAVQPVVAEPTFAG